MFLLETGPNNDEVIKIIEENIYKKLQHWNQFIPAQIITEFIKKEIEYEIKRYGNLGSYRGFYSSTIHHITDDVLIKSTKKYNKIKALRKLKPHLMMYIGHQLYKPGGLRYDCVKNNFKTIQNNLN